MPKRKTHKEFIDEVYNVVGDEYSVLGEYRNNTTKIVFAHNICNHKWDQTPKDFLNSKTKCPKCGKTPKYTYDQVKNYIELELDKGFKLLSVVYINNSVPLEIMCNEGHVFPKSLSDIKQGSYCRVCSNTRKSREQRLPYDLVKSHIECDGYKLLSDTYVNKNEVLLIKCPEDHEFNKSYNDFHYGKQRCPECYKIRIRENATSSLFAYLRTYMTEWKYGSMKACSYKCVLTGDKFDAVHHLYSFNLIAKETMDLTNIPIYQTISEYNDSEINTLIETCKSLHVKYGLGVCLREDVHRLFHAEYGFNNTPKQFEELEQDILMAIINEHLKIILKYQWRIKMDKTIQVARFRSTPYTVNYLTNGGIKTYQWSGTKGNKTDVKSIPSDVVDWLLMNSRCFPKGELVIVDDSEEAKEIISNIDDVEQYVNNTHSREDVVKLLEGNFKKLESELKKITVEEEKRFIIQTAKEIKLDSNSKLKLLAEWAKVPQDVLFSE